jgi:hypothetical protein
MTKTFILDMDSIGKQLTDLLTTAMKSAGEAVKATLKQENNTKADLKADRIGLSIEGLREQIKGMPSIA